MSKRKQPSLSTKLASALLALGQIPYDDAKQMTAAQLISLYNCDHGIFHVHDGPPDFWNLTPRLIQAHRVKTATIDVPAIAKGKRIRRKEEEHLAQMLGCSTIAIIDRKLHPPRKRKIPQRVNPWPKGRKFPTRRRT